MVYRSVKGKMSRLIIKESFSTISYDPLQVCGGVCICRAVFRMSIGGQPPAIG